MGKIYDKEQIQTAIDQCIYKEILYIRYTCEDQTLLGIEKAAFRLHCSSRQLQRILNKFDQNGIIEKLGKGCYRLRSTQ